MPGTPGRRDRRKLDTWHAIRAAASRLFLERGFEATSIDDIASAAGISRATFFNYFTTKEAVLFDPAPDEGVRLRALWDELPDPGCPWTTIRHYLVRYLRSLGDQAATTRTLIDASPALAVSGRSLGDRLRPQLGAWLAERYPARDTFDLTVLVDVAVSAGLTAFRLWHPEQGLEHFHELVDHSLSLVSVP